MKKILPVVFLLLLLTGCTGNVSTTPEQSTPPVTPSQNQSVSTLPATQKKPRLWHYDMTSDGIFRTDENSGEVVKINDSNFPAGIILTEDWVYYFDNGSLYRMDNENNQELLSDEECRRPCLSGDKIYYLNSSGIHRMDLDGSNKVRVIQCESDGMVVADKYIFYAAYYPVELEPGWDDMPPPPLGMLHRVDLNGENDIDLEVPVNFLSVYENTIYYSNTDDYAFYSLNPETLEAAKVDKVRMVEDPYFADGYLFFMSASDRSFYRLSLRDGSLTWLMDGWPRCWGILDGYVYVESFYGETEDEVGIFRIKTNGTEPEKLA